MTKHVITINDVQVQVLREAVTAWLAGHAANKIDLDPAVRANANDLIRILGRTSLRGAPFDGWDQAAKPITKRVW